MSTLKEIIDNDIWDDTLGNMILEAMEDDGDFYRAVNRMYLRYVSFGEADTNFNINMGKAERAKGMDEALTDITGYCFASYEKACRTDRLIGYHERENE